MTCALTELCNACGSDSALQQRFPNMQRHTRWSFKYLHLLQMFESVTSDRKQFWEFTVRKQTSSLLCSHMAKVAPLTNNTNNTGLITHLLFSALWENHLDYALTWFSWHFPELMCDNSLYFTNTSQVAGLQCLPAIVRNSFFKWLFSKQTGDSTPKTPPCD